MAKTPTKQRVFLHKNKELLDLPNLIKIQTDSYKWFIDEGLKEIFEELSPIEDFTGKKYALSLKQYHFEQPKLTKVQAKNKNLTYEASLKVAAELLNKETGEVKTQEIFLGDYPVMTNRGTFIINGVERVVVSQLVRSPGVFFTRENTASYFGAKVIPNRGAWLEIETSQNGVMSVKIDRKRKIALTALLRAFGYGSDKELKELFSDVDNGEVKFIDETIAKDPSSSTAEALMEVYRRIRPGDLATVENSKSLIDGMFFDYKRYDFSKVGRYKVNKRLGINLKNTAQNRILRREDFVEIIKEVIRLSNANAEPEDIDHLANRRLKMVGELMQQRFRVGILRMERIVKDRMSLAEPDTIMPAQLVNARPIVASVKEFFASHQLSQFMDQINPLAEIVHKRRLNAMGPGGLNRERAGFEVRDVHRTHYGRICPIETPEGPNIGLVSTLATYARVNEYGFLESPYLKVINSVTPEKSAGETASQAVKDKSGKVILKAGDKITSATAKKLKSAGIESVAVKAHLTNEIVFLDAYDEEKAVIAQANTPTDENGYFIESRVAVRGVGGDADEESADNVSYMDVTSKQTVGVSASLIPFLENDDAKRALMGANMQRQAVALIRPDSPVVGTGIEGKVAVDSGQVIVAEDDGVVLSATADRIDVKYKKLGNKSYELTNFERSNQGSCIHQKAVAIADQKLKKGDVLADGMSTQDGELALGQNVLVAFMPFEGLNFEDAIIVSQRLVQDDRYTSIHIETHQIDVRDTKLGPEIVTRDIPNVSEDSLKDLDEEGIIRIGAEVGAGDILVGKITPKGETELSSEERLLRAIFGEKARDVKDTSLRVPNGASGKVVDVKILSRENNDDLPAGVSTQIYVAVAELSKVQVGDKMAGRHGDKGVISKIMPIEDMPYMEDGTPVDIILNTLGVGTRMNLGQILETHLGWAANALGYKIASPVFDGVKIDEIKEELKKAGLPEDGKTQLYSGYTGEPYSSRTTVGIKYMLKLSHMVDSKIHARSTGPYAMVTQQPLGGKAQMGGQRFGEMEVWALEAYGAANTLQEILTIKSDDVIGRSKAYESIIKGEDIKGPRVPESFNVLVKELQSLSLVVDLERSKEAITIDAEELISTATNDEAVELGNDELMTGDNQEKDEAIVDLADTKSEDDFAVLAEAELKSEIESEEI
ncbi:MAG: DNA-directed polymerase subunit beta [Patescibacteria group bacterium]|jgi:DNA-directed RNA polymerase subunit beta|nr:DNA-directed polymerase subunit beta [Patescibacteria group bacterium]